MKTLFPENLGKVFDSCRPMALAFSGGLDSRFLAHASRAFLPGHSLRLVHVRGPHVPEDESREAEAWARARGHELMTLPFDPLSIAGVRANGADRCYHCKKAMFSGIGRALAACPDDGRQKAVLCDGSNASDGLSFRPGLAALRELGVRSPLAEAGLDKDAIRSLAAKSGLDRPHQKARPCLLTRFAYGLEPDADILAALERAERAVGRLLAAVGPGAAPADTRADAAGPDFRLRLTARAPVPAAAAHATPAASWRGELHLDAEVPAAVKEAVSQALSELGFDNIPLVLMKAVSGHYDRVNEGAI